MARKAKREALTLDLTPLIDVVFILLIFFMLTSSSVMPNALNLKLPGRSSGSSTNPSKPARIDVSRSGTYYLNNSKTSFSNLEKKMS